jgi:cold shock CspA family protein
MRASRNMDERHLSVQSIVDYFDAIGGYEAAIDKCLLRLLEGGLVEAYDSSVRDLSPAQKLAISACGVAHLRLAVFNEVFSEQMAITTPLANTDVVARIKALYLSKGPANGRLREIQRVFNKYLVDEDSRHLSHGAEGPQYLSQRHLLDQLSAASGTAKVPPQPTKPTIVAEGVLATVDWFDTEKGYGFVDVEGIEGGIFLHSGRLEEAGIQSVADGDDILCDVASHTRGLHVIKVHDVQTDPASADVFESEIVRLFPERGYGFVRLLDSPNDAFFHYSVVPQSEREKLSLNRRVKVNLGPDRLGKGLQVRKIIEFLGKPLEEAAP